MKRIIEISEEELENVRKYRSGKSTISVNAQIDRVANSTPIEECEDCVSRKEPTTKNCESCKYFGSHHGVCNYCYKCSLWTKKESTTKNDKIDCQRTDCNNCVNHKYCDYEPTAKNDLGVDCISRTQLERELNAQIAVDAISKETALDMLEHLPSVYPKSDKPSKCGENMDNYINALKWLIGIVDIDYRLDKPYVLRGLQEAVRLMEKTGENNG